MPTVSVVTLAKGRSSHLRNILRGLERDRDVVAFPWPLAALARGALLVPERVRTFGLRGLRFRNRPRR